MPRFGTFDEDDDLNEGLVVCPTCKGKTAIFENSDPEDHVQLEKTGKERPCPACNGSGYVQGKCSFL